MPKNYMEDVIEHLLPTVLDNYQDICKCEKCLEDIRAIALNQFKPLYAATELGSVFVRVNETDVQFRTDVLNQIIRAVEIVSKNPRHSYSDKVS